MKVLQQRYSWERSKDPVELWTVVRDELDGSDYGVGELEALGDSERNAREFLGSLTELLVSKGVLSLEEVGSLLGTSLEPA